MFDFTYNFIKNRESTSSYFTVLIILTWTVVHELKGVWQMHHDFNNIQSLRITTGAGGSWTCSTCSGMGLPVFIDHRHHHTFARNESQLFYQVDRCHISHSTMTRSTAPLDTCWPIPLQPTTIFPDGLADEVYTIFASQSLAANCSPLSQTLITKTARSMHIGHEFFSHGHHRMLWVFKSFWFPWRIQPSENIFIPMFLVYKASLSTELC